MFDGLITSTLLMLAFPAAILLGAVLGAKKWRPDVVGNIKPLAGLTATYPVWMFVWIASVAIFGGMIGPCGSAPATPITLCIFILPPSLVMSSALARGLRSGWAFGIPFLADGVLLAVSQMMDPHGILEGTATAWAPYLWIGVVIGVGAMYLARAPRRNSGACATCGYSRLGLPSGSPCPECGASLPSHRQ